MHKMMQGKRKRGRMGDMDPCNSEGFLSKDIVCKTYYNILHVRVSSSLKEYHSLIHSSFSTSVDIANVSPPQEQRISDSVLGEGNSSKLRKRGKSKCLDLARLGPHEKMQLRWNERGQAVGPCGKKLSSYLGKIVRDNKIAPKNYKDWRRVPQHFKNDLWEMIKQKFEVSEDNKNFIFQKMGRRWRECKNQLVRNFYDPYDNDVDRLAHVPEGFQPQQWKEMVTYLGSKKWQELRERNKRCNEQQVLRPRSGRKPMEQIGDDMRLEKGDLSAKIDRVNVWKRAYIRANGSTSTQEAKEINEKLDKVIEEDPSSMSTARDDCIARVLGLDRPGRVRAVGVTATIKTCFQNQPSYLSSSQVTHNLNELKKENEELKRNQQEMSEEMSRIINMLQQVVPMNGISLETVQSRKTYSHTPLNNLSVKFIDGQSSRSNNEGEEVNMNSLPNRFCGSKQFDGQEDDIMSPCQLLDINKKVVATGVILGRNSNFMLDNENLKERFLAISVKRVKKFRTPLMVQTKNMTTLKEAKGKVIAWPSQYVKEVVDGPPSVASLLCNKECILKDGHGNTVATARILSENPTSLVHHAQLGCNAYKVKLEHITISSTKLFFKTSFSTTLADVGVKGITSWPKKFTIVI